MGRGKKKKIAALGGKPASPNDSAPAAARSAPPRGAARRAAPRTAGAPSPPLPQGFPVPGGRGASPERLLNLSPAF